MRSARSSFLRSFNQVYARFVTDDGSPAFHSNGGTLRPALEEQHLGPAEVSVPRARCRDCGQQASEKGLQSLRSGGPKENKWFLIAPWTNAARRLCLRDEETRKQGWQHPGPTPGVQKVE